MNLSDIQSGVADTLMVLLMLALAHTVTGPRAHVASAKRQTDRKSSTSVALTFSGRHERTHASGNGSSHSLTINMAHDGTISYQGKPITVNRVEHLARSRKIGTLHIKLANFNDVSHTLRELNKHGLAVQLN